MKQCHGCRRHIFCQDDICPFCEIPLPTVGPFVAGVPIALGITLAACGPGLSGSDGTDTQAESTTVASADGTATGGASAESTAAPATSSTTFASTSDGDTTIATEDDSADGPVGFYGVPSDFMPETFECDLSAQDCPPGEKCMPWANDGGLVWNATRCSPLDPNPDQVGEPCLVEGSDLSGIDTCDVGLSCFLVDAMGQGECIPVCSGAPIDCDASTMCLQVPGVPQIGYCVVPGLCDPLGTDCEANEVCVPPIPFFDGTGQGLPTVFQCLPDASGPGGAYGDACEAQNSCDPGLVCVPGGDVPGCAGGFGAECCTVVCDPSTPMVCPANALGQTCVDIGGGVGACLVP